jgi:hypothetical protein
MAKILFGAGVGDARGSVGAMTFTKGRFGAVMRAKVSPVQPRTSTVLTIRSQFSELAKRWSNILTDDQRLAWSALASTVNLVNAFGNIYHPTGLQLYERSNRNLDLIAQPHIDDPPDNLDVSGLLTINATATAAPAAMSVAFTPTPLGADDYLVVAASPQMPPGRSFFGNRLKHIFSGAAASVSPANVLAGYLSVWGSLRAGNKIQVKAWVIRDTNGAASTPLSDTVTVA